MPNKQHLDTVIFLKLNSFLSLNFNKLISIKFLYYVMFYYFPDDQVVIAAKEMM